MKLKLRHKITLILLLPITAIYILAFGAVFLQLNQIFRNNLINQTTKVLKSSTLYFSSVFDKDIEILRSIKNTIMALNTKPFNERIDDQNKIIGEILYDTPQYLSLGISWELSSILSNYNKTHGRFRYLYFIDKGKMNIKTDTMNVDQEAIGSLYYLFKISKVEDITDIYFDTYTGRQEDLQLMNSIALPLIENQQFIGLIVVDISLSRLNDIVNKMKPSQQSQVIMVSHSGRIVANTDNSKYINELVSKALPQRILSRNVINTIQEGKSDYFEYKDSLNQKFYVFIEPFYFGSIKRAWSIMTIIPEEIIIKNLNDIRNTIFVAGIIGFLLIIIIIYILSNSLLNPIREAVESLKKLAELDISDKYSIKHERTDEIGEINDSVNILITSLNRIKEVTLEISKGNLDINIKPVSDNDNLTRAINEMQRSLKISQIEEEKRREEEQISRLIVEGESKISEILRENLQNLDKLSYETVSYLVKYTKSAQGALFLVDHKENEIELLAAYAYDRRKYLTKKIPFGVGLLGRAVKEGEMIYITEVPEGYATISSGLGQEQPRTLLIVPFKFNEVIYALLELSSFKGYKPFIRNFIQKVGVSIASTLANLQITKETNVLVNELKIKTQELTTQQEEMRQNLEEMKATQEEMRRKNQEFENIVIALNQVSYVITYNIDREIIDANQNILTLFKKSKDQLVGIKQGAFNVEDQTTIDFDNLWKNIESGRITRITQKVEIEGKKFIFSEAYIPIVDENGKIYKVINIANDITNVSL